MGINHGVLNRKEYLPAVEKARAGLTQSLSPDPCLNRERRTCSPRRFASEGGAFRPGIRLPHQPCSS
ncbi:hypothetical protein SBA2_300012 [Acidobacteriia bacterium SbA2]|nr:hypothetical protein SBA2_300012 [Acidobacteriia bacterium SbA2]